MNIFLVGGAVRDSLLGIPVTERDWVVVGASADQMRGLGYTQVGQDFPVFLHPQTKEEYALARTERKKGQGHLGFECQFDPSVTLEQDLARRDLTINAIAQDSNGQLIDPYGGQRDLSARVLRHVTDAFSEDPLRVLRVARFGAKLRPYDFTLDPSTLALMRDIVAAGELSTLPPERLWRECEKAFKTDAPGAFWQSLSECDAIAALTDGAISVAWQPSLEGLTQLTDDYRQRVCIWLAELELSGEQQTLLTRTFGIPITLTHRAGTLRQVPQLGRHPADLSASEVFRTIDHCRGFRQGDDFELLVQAATVRAQLHDIAQTERNQQAWLAAAECANRINRDAVSAELSGPALGDGIRLARIAAIDQWLTTSENDAGSSAPR